MKTLLRSSFLPVTLSLALLTACGGSTQPASADSGSKDATASDAKARDTGAAGCVVTPVVGAACTPGVAACAPGNVCCTGEWMCSGAHTWLLNRGTCVCREDAGARDSGSLPDGGVSVTSCAGCSGSEICVTTVSSGGVCELANDAGMCAGGGTGVPGQCCNTSSTSYLCVNPLLCPQGLSCACASSLCHGGCGCVDASTSGTSVGCSCQFP